MQKEKPFFFSFPSDSTFECCLKGNANRAKYQIIKVFSEFTDIFLVADTVSTDWLTGVNQLADLSQLVV